MQLWEPFSHESHEEMEGMVYSLHIKRVETEQKITSIHQIRKCSERMLLISIAMNQDRTCHVTHPLYVAEVRPQHRISDKQVF